MPLCHTLTFQWSMETEKPSVCLARTEIYFTDLKGPWSEHSVTLNNSTQCETKSTVLLELNHWFLLSWNEFSTVRANNNKRVSSSKKSLLSPFLQVDGYHESQTPFPKAEEAASFWEPQCLQMWPLARWRCTTEQEGATAQATFGVRWSWPGPGCWEMRATVKSNSLSKWWHVGLRYLVQGPCCKSSLHSSNLSYIRK